ncbi:peptidoglycan-binding domain-containing protein [Allocoleopsis franciscana]|uniref:Putative peptidoglycan-binding domain-containing protein n=1 Tax=Allocoleopsis franciscana PCC 7113 TaxID=1173027 RepID=K9WKN9_9CYAN|nr:peptidoglycan-binding domain-containing protein [Allocoleopsis franciscana]AFZ20349.1 putative peptidoglycan-binding domain-containing protein [Allocoleopsis franciscana PCC 7113]
MKLQDFIGKDLKYSMEGIATDKELATQIQVLLIGLRLLEPPADGKFGPISQRALQKFQTLMKINEPEQLGAETAKQLIETKPEDLPTPPLKLGNDLASRIVKYMQLKKYEIFQGIGEYNIVYIEGMNADATLNNDPPNYFNDRRMVIQIVDGVPAIVGNWQATTEPGYRYTERPMNPEGAARIKFGQYKAWQVGIHGTADRHEALIQTGGTVTVHRDFNKDYQRVGDKEDTGYFAINQHWGYDLPSNNVYYASAGCLVGRLRQGHREFMSLIKKDRRFQLNSRYIFYTTVIYGQDLMKETGGLSESLQLLKEGSSGPLVKQLQQALKDKGFNPGTIDGVFGLGTKAAVRAFQQANKLEADGLVGKQTWNALGIA